MDLLTTNETAHALGISPRRVRQLIRAGMLPAVRVGRDWGIRASAVAGYCPRPTGRPKKNDGG